MAQLRNLFVGRQVSHNCSAWFIATIDLGIVIVAALGVPDGADETRHHVDRWHCLSVEFCDCANRTLVNLGHNTIEAQEVNNR